MDGTNRACTQTITYPLIFKTYCLPRTRHASSSCTFPVPQDALRWRRPLGIWVSNHTRFQSWSHIICLSPWAILRRTDSAITPLLTWKDCALTQNGLIVRRRSFPSIGRPKISGGLRSLDKRAPTGFGPRSPTYAGFARAKARFEQGGGRQRLLPDKTPLRRDCRAAVLPRPIGLVVPEKSDTAPGRLSAHSERLDQSIILNNLESCESQRPHLFRP